MGLMGQIFNAIFGGSRNIIKETAEVFRPNAEAQAKRTAAYNHAALGQFSAEFAMQRKGWFDRFVDALNRLPRPVLALGVIGLFISAMWEPVWFAERMQGVTLIPEPLWWLMGVIVSFYFGARHQAKGQEFQKSIAQTMARVPDVIDNIETLRELRHDSPGVADAGTDAQTSEHALNDADNNRALEDWRAAQ